MNSNDNVLNLLSDLIKFESVTPDNSDCQKYIENYLSVLGFKTEYIKYGDVQNMISTLGNRISMFDIRWSYRCCSSWRLE